MGGGYAKANLNFTHLPWILAPHIERWKRPEFNNRHPCWSATSVSCSRELQSISNADAFWINRALELDTLPVVRLRCMYLHDNRQTSLRLQCKCFLQLSMEMGVRGYRAWWLCCCWLEHQFSLTEGIIIGQMAGLGHFTWTLWCCSECSGGHIRMGGALCCRPLHLDSITFDLKQVCFVPGLSLCLTQQLPFLFSYVLSHLILSVDGNGNVFLVTMLVLAFSIKHHCWHF